MTSEYGSNPEITAMIDNINFEVIPVLNVDGYAYSWTNVRFKPNFCCSSRNEQWICSEQVKRDIFSAYKHGRR